MGRHALGWYYVWLVVVGERLKRYRVLDLAWHRESCEVRRAALKMCGSYCAKLGHEDTHRRQNAAAHRQIQVMDDFYSRFFLQQHLHRSFPCRVTNEQRAAAGNNVWCVHVWSGQVCV